MATDSPAKRFKSSNDAAPFRVIYWPGLPGRGEFVRLALEEAGAHYTDSAKEPDGIQDLMAQISSENHGAGHGNIPPLAPPILEHGDIVISQTSNILLYLGQHLEGLAPKASDDAAGLYRVNALALTVLDGLSDEVHNCHHPICSSLFYEDQKAEAIASSKKFVALRLPKYLAYFERVLASKADDTPWLYGGALTYADLLLFQGLDGTRHQYPKAVAAAQASGNYDRVFQLYDAVKLRPKIAAYLASPRRQAYAAGIYRYYPELDLLPEKDEEEAK